MIDKVMKIFDVRLLRLLTILAALLTIAQFFGLTNPVGSFVVSILS